MPGGGFFVCRNFTDVHVEASVRRSTAIDRNTRSKAGITDVAGLLSGHLNG